MADYEFEDALTHNFYGFNEDGGVVQAVSDHEPEQTPSIFMPGCSLINYAMPLVSAIYDTLVEMEVVSGITLVCCGRILIYEEEGKARKAHHEDVLRERLLAAGVERVVTACPNCMNTLRKALAADPRTAAIEVVALPKVMADLGFEIEPGSIASVVKDHADATGAGVVLCIHDSCPDRAYGEFADGIRALLPDDMWVEPTHCREKSICCGSLARAANNQKLADEQAQQNGVEAAETGADCIVTGCISCALQLNRAQSLLPARHVMELLYEWPIDWQNADPYMSVQVLFENEA